MLYDTHCHPYLAKEKSQESILENFFDNGGVYLNTIGTDLEANQACIDIAKNYDGAFAAIGIHPTHVLDYAEKLTQTMQALEKQYEENTSHVVAIGEAGLDYYWLDSLSKQYSIEPQEIKRIQREFFVAQIRLAQKLQLPLVIHNRESSRDIFTILQQENFTNFVFHCFSEERVFAEKLLDFAPNCKLGFGGITTFKNAHSIAEVAASISLKNIIIETDSPYLTPVPYRGKEENEPLFVKYVLDTIVDLRDEDEETIKNQIFENSRDFFGIAQ